MSTRIDPFKASRAGGGYYVTADDRIGAVARFDRAQCEAALLQKGLQKTVVSALNKRLRHLDKIALTLHFEDHGQDFMRWELDLAGKVIGVEPFQFSIWGGVKVLQPQLLRKGSIVRFVNPGESTEEKTIRYPLTKVTKGAA